MRNVKRKVSLLLIVLLLLAILPTAAHADPPYGTTHKHNWVVIQYLASTCEDWGRTTWRCSLCNEVYSEMTAPLGHDWDEGVVIQEPTLFNPGVKTQTCKRDPSHTRTASIDPLISSLKVATYNEKPLIITEQPVGGSVTRYGDETHLLHVAASGGQGAYTYGWFSSPVNETDWLPGFWILASIHYSGRLTEPDYEASEGGRRYWCVVTDEAGNSAVSDTVVVEYKLSIGKQPEDVNLQLDDPHFYCEAIDGSGNYTYTWFDSEMGILGEGQSYPATEPGICYCYCVVKDNVTGETVESEYCEVYDEEPFRLVRITKDCELWPEETGMVVAAFTGGTPDYEIWWDKDGTAINSVEGLVDDHPGSHVDANGPGKYTVHAVDAHGEVVTATCTVSEKHLTIIQQPQSGTIPAGGYATVDIAVADGEAPYTYNLYAYWLKYRSETYESKSNSYRIWYPGSYRYIVVDANGHTAISDYVFFKKSDFRIKDQTESANLAKPGDTVILSVEVEGGKAPYTYEWMQYRGDTPWYTTASTTDTCPARQPGRYACYVKDDAGDTVHSEYILVTYTGDTPWIIVQPKGGILEKDGSLELTCEAISGSGGELRYEWEKTTIGVRPSWKAASRSGRSTSTSITASTAASYRCKVTDTKTGKYTYSEIAMVCEKLLVTSCEMTHWSAEDYSYKLQFTGGVAPYTIQVYLTVKQMNDPKTILWKTYTVNTPEEASDFHGSIPAHWDYTYYSEDEKVWKKASESTEAYAVITDTRGGMSTIHIKIN